MPATETRGSLDSLQFVAHVAGTACTVRARWVLPIAEALGVADQLQPAVPADGQTEADGDRMADLCDIIDSHLIAAPRPRRRRDRSVSSRAVFYAGGTA